MRMTAAAIALTVAGCIAGMAGGGATANAASTTPQVSGAAIVQTALRYVNYPYVAIGHTPQTGFSSIGFVSFVYRQDGVPLPRSLGKALASAPKVSRTALQPGDILYFQNTYRAGLSTAGIYIGNGQFVLSEWYGYGVRIASFTNDPRDGNYWSSRFLAANRPLV